MCCLASVLNRSDHKTVEFSIPGEVRRWGGWGRFGAGSITASLDFQRVGT